MKTPLVAIIDYGMGNLFSIVQACNKVYLDTLVVSSTDVIGSADGLILPGVGAFGDAIETLKKLSLFDKIKREGGVNGYNCSIKNYLHNTYKKYYVGISPLLYPE